MSKIESKTTTESVLELGTWLGRRQAFGLMSSRCTAADAECLKAMRDGGEFKTLGLTWNEFCLTKVGISRRHADRLIAHLEEFGPNYFRISELMEISPATYRLIAGSVSDDGLEHDGRRIPLTPENRQQVVEIVEAARTVKVEKGKTQTSAEALCKRLETLLVDAAALTSQERLVMAGLLRSGMRRLERPVS